MPQSVAANMISDETSWFVREGCMQCAVADIALTLGDMEARRNSFV
jgi:hypothetical protein